MTEPDDRPLVSVDDLETAERVLLLAFDARRRARLPGALRRHHRSVLELRALGFPNELAPAAVVSARHDDDPLPAPVPPAGATVGFGRGPDSDAGTSYLSIAELASAYRAGSARPSEVTEAFLARIERFDPQLCAVITPTTARARAEAEQADDDFEAGIDRGPLQGVPYLAKDLLAVPDAPTTWGAMPYRQQRFSDTAAVVERLAAAGAVLLGKASLGALAMGDVWYGGTTRNPWDLSEGSSGSSAGSSAAVAAGLCTFAIGSETMGSILSPSDRCGVVGLRPTFGRVSRFGAMALAWSLDKLGPITRTVEDAALVLTAIAGHDPRDAATREAPFPWLPQAPVERLRVGVPDDVRGEPTPAMAAFLAAAEAAGVTIAPVRLPDLPTEPIMTLLMVEASAAFDVLIRGDEADMLVRQNDESWPVLLRAARFVSAPDYVQAQRLQRAIRDELAARFAEVDLIVTPARHGPAMLHGNAAGAPALSLPVGRNESGRPLGNVAILARPFFEHRALGLAQAIEARFGPLAVPPGFEV